MTSYAGFAFSASMLPRGMKNLTFETLEFSPEVGEEVKASVPCFNKSHEETIKAVKEKFGLVLEIPDVPPSINLVPGDIVYILQVRGLSRLVDRKEYTEAEIDGCEISFEKVSFLS